MHFIEHDPQKETFDSLNDISKLSLYNYEGGWSTQLEFLRKFAIENGSKVTSQFILNYFTDLRIFDPEVNKIDPAMKKLKNLKEGVTLQKENHNSHPRHFVLKHIHGI